MPSRCPAMACTPGARPCHRGDQVIASTSAARCDSFATRALRQAEGRRERLRGHDVDDRVAAHDERRRVAVRAAAARRRRRPAASAARPRASRRSAESTDRGTAAPRRPRRAGRSRHAPAPRASDVCPGSGRVRRSRTRRGRARRPRRSRGRGRRHTGWTCGTASGAPSSGIRHREGHLSDRFRCRPRSAGAAAGGPGWSGARRRRRRRGAAGDGGDADARACRRRRCPRRRGSGDPAARTCAREDLVARRHDLAHRREVTRAAGERIADERPDEAEDRTVEGGGEQQRRAGSSGGRTARGSGPRRAPARRPTAAPPSATRPHVRRAVTRSICLRSVPTMRQFSTGNWLSDRVSTAFCASTYLLEHTQRHGVLQGQRRESLASPRTLRLQAHASILALPTRGRGTLRP